MRVRACAPADRDEAYRGHIHAEPASGGGYERDLHRYRHEPERTRKKGMAEQDLDAESRRYTGNETDDVRGRAHEQRALFDHAR
jgi:hypothetical protein